MPGPSQRLTRDKVFCRDCLYLANVSGDTQWPVLYKCEHPDNRDKKQDTWYKPNVGQKRPPNKINKKNTCHWYKTKCGGKRLL